VGTHQAPIGRRRHYRFDCHCDCDCGDRCRGIQSFVFVFVVVVDRSHANGDRRSNAARRRSRIGTLYFLILFHKKHLKYSCMLSEQPIYFECLSIFIFIYIFNWPNRSRCR
jgi:hypothetical protein